MTPPSLSSQTEPARIDRAAFAAELTPCLSLTGGVGMSADDRREWLNAAYRAIGHFSLINLKHGAAEALRTADHPSKIVPVITAAVEREKASRYQPMASIVRPDVTALPAPGRERPTADEVAEIAKRYGVGSFARNQAADPSRPTRVATTADPDRPCRMPSRADYIRLFGVDPEAMPAAEAMPS